MEYPQLHASATTRDNYRVELLERKPDHCGPKYYVRVDNGRDVLDLIDYYELSDARVAFKAELVHWRRIAEGA